jgi:hypothetical protein
MNRTVLTLACLAACVGVRHAHAQSPTSGFAADLEERARAIRPSAEETRWQQIPWVRSVVAGQKAALAENRPIMYWHVDDDPLERC